MALDITISPLYRVGGQDQSSLPGLMAAMPPRKTGRGRQQDRLIVYLVLGGEAPVSTGDYVQAASRAAVSFFETPGTLTGALRSAATSINQYLYSRNQARSAPGQYTVGLLALAAVRDSQLTLLMSGPMQAFVISSRGVQQIAESLSGRGLGLNESPPHHFSQIGSGWTSFEGRTAGDVRHAILAGTSRHHGAFHGTVGQLGTFGLQLRKYGRDARAEIGGRVRRDGTGRDHGYPGGHLRPPRFDPEREPRTRRE